MNPAEIAPPTCQSVVLTTPEDTQLDFSLNSYFTSTAGASLYRIILNSSLTTPIGGSLSANGIAITNFPATPLAGTVPASLSYMPPQDASGLTTFTYYVMDNSYQRLTSAACTVTINVTAVNDPPTLAVNTTSIVVARGATSPGFLVTVTDIDSPSVAVYWNGSSIPLNSILQADGSILSTSATTIISNFQLTNNAYSFVVQWLPSGTTPSGATGYAFFTAFDSSSLASVPKNVTVQFRTLDNVAPFHVSQNYPTIYEDAATCVPVSFTASDPDLVDQQNIQVTLIQSTTKGTINFTSAAGYVSGTAVTGATNYSVCYKPNADFNGEDYFLVQYKDQLGLTSPVARINITVLPVNDPPTSANVSVHTNVNTTAGFVISGNDIDGDALTLYINQDVSLLKGTVRSSGTNITTAVKLNPTVDGSWSFDYMAPYFNVNESFTFTVSDGTVNSSVYYVNIRVDGEFIYVNQPPNVTDIWLQTNEDTPITFNLDDYSIDDLDGHHITLYIIDPVTGTTVGEISNSAGVILGNTSSLGSSANHNITFTPTANYCSGSNFTFGYFAKDGYGAKSVNATVNIKIKCVNDPPTWFVTPTTVTGTRSVTSFFNYSITDIDSASVTVRINASQLAAFPTGSTVYIGGQLVDITGDFVVTLPNPNPGQPIILQASWVPPAGLPDGFSKTFWAQLTDTEGARAPDVSVTLTVVNNHPPVAYDVNITIYEDNAPVTIYLNGTDVDVGHTQRLTIGLVTLPKYGKLDSETPTPQASNSLLAVWSVVYTVNASFYGVDKFNYTVTDPVGATATAQVTINVIHVNHVPKCQNQIKAVKAGENLTLSLEGSDPDLNDVISFNIIDSRVVKGTIYEKGNLVQVVLNKNYTTTAPWVLLYNTSIGDEGNYSFLYRVSDNGNPLLSAVCNVTIFVGQVIIPNQPPVVENITIFVNEDTLKDIDLLDYITDPEGDPIANLTFAFYPNGSLITLTADGNNVSQVLYPDSTGSFPIVLVPQLDQNGNTTFAYYATDDKNATSIVPGYITIVVLPVNDPPTITVDPTTLTVARLSSGFVSFTVNDIDSDKLYVKILQNNVTLSTSTLVFDAQGAKTEVTVADLLPSIFEHLSGNLPDTQSDFISWSPAATATNGYQGSFQLQVSDGALTDDSQFVDLYVVLNSPPYVILPNDTIPAKQETSKNITLLVSDPDVSDQTNLTIIISGLPVNGNITINGQLLKIGDILTGTSANEFLNATQAYVTYKPDNFFRGIDTFQFYTVDQLGAQSKKQDVYIEITEFVDHPPTSEDYELHITEDYCLVTGTCPAPETSPLYVELFAQDPDGETYWFNLLSTGDAAKGSIVLFNGTHYFKPTSGQLRLDSGNTKVYYQPLPGLSSTGLFDKVNFTVHTASGDALRQYTISIFVAPVNDPPTGAAAIYNIPMETTINFELAHADVDDPASQLNIFVVSFAKTNLGKFKYNATTNFDGGYLQGFNLTFYPDPNAYNDVEPIGQLTYRVIDPHGATSPDYNVSILVGFVAKDITYRNDTTLYTPEDTSIYFKVNRYGTDYFGGNVGLTEVSLSISNISLKHGTLLVCNDDFSGCVQTAGGNITTGALLYIPAADQNGNASLTFSLTLKPQTGAPAITVPYTINVIPVNDSPKLVAGFNLTSSGKKNECDEDTFFVVTFNATDIDSPSTAIKAEFLQFLYQGAPGSYFLCDGNGQSKSYGGCSAGTELTPGFFDATDDKIPLFSFVFVPNANANGVVRLVFRLYDGIDYSTENTIVEITVLPINDPPQFDDFDGKLSKANTTLVTGENETVDAVFLTSAVSDIDFRFGRNLSVTYTIIKTAGMSDNASPNANGNANANGGNSNQTKRDVEQQTNGVERNGHFDMPTESASGEKAPCVVAADGLSITCNSKIEKLNPWLRAGVVLVPDLGVEVVTIGLYVNDLGNIDKLNRPRDANETLVFQLPAAALVASVVPTTNNVALIAAPIAGLIAGALIAGLIFFIKRKSAKAAVESYFDNFALGMEGATNSSPLYVEAKKGGESPIYQPSK